MRVALLASTFALMAGTPAFAQCIYVACNGGGQPAPVYQQPVYQAPQYQAPTPAPRAAPGYDEGYAAGLAARPAPRHGVRAAARRATPSRATPTRAVPARAAPARTGAARVAQRPTHGATGARSGAGMGRGTGTVTASMVRRPAAAPRAAVTTRQAQGVRRAPVGVAQTRRATTSQVAVRQRSYTPSNVGPYQDPIKDRAASYRPAVYGQSTTMASMMSGSRANGQYTTTWSGPASVVNQGGRVCGWGARLVTNSHGYAQRQAVWVCQCPQGWRPPGY
jgi:hypothetical protein